MSNVELEENAPVLAFTLIEGNMPVQLTVTAGDVSRWTSGDFKPGDAKPIGVITKFLFNQEAQSARQSAFYIALMSFIRTLIEKGQQATASIVLEAWAGMEVERQGELLEARMGADWLEQAGQAVTVMVKDILTPVDPSKEN
jgi:hypothetical protein